MKKITRLIKPIYNIFPWKKEFLIFMKTLGIKGAFTRHLYFKGIFSFEVNGKKIRMYNPGYLSHIENNIFWRGIENGWEKESVKIWLVLSRNAKIIVDVGANTGIFSLLSKSVNENAKVISFEPVPFINEKFTLNMQLNNFKCDLHEFALSDTNSTLDVYSETLNNSYTISIDKKNMEGKNEPFNKIIINSIRLDDFIERTKVGKIDLMKIDVERHEPKVLEGMGKYLKEMKPDLLIEIQTEEIAIQIYDMVKDLGYLYFNIDENGYITQTDIIYKSNYLNYLICSSASAILLRLKEE